MHLIAHATGQQQGGRSHQCDARAVTGAPGSITAFAVLDGIGSDATVRAFSRAAAGRLARAAVRSRSAEHGLRQVYEQYASAWNEFTRAGEEVGAAALVGLVVPGQPLEVAWCGDVRAYAIRDQDVEQLTRDHNLRRVHLDRSRTPSEYDRNVLTSCLGAHETDVEVRREYGHPAIERVTVEPEELRLILATDGAYEPLEELGQPLSAYGNGYPAQAAQQLANDAVRLSCAVRRPHHVDNATVLIVDLVP
ncbi:PP2C family serine/threonine-protein phosphatase [Streptomyces sp. NPDC056056]|uniref:PP2C family serine/threonine-protein phosphatase n=1 Tax=Streptomyces sp. NPDC056056 TaxID=3345698 RepID=UPI0035E29037